MKTPLLLSLASAILLLTGCISPKPSPSPRYFQLQPQTPPPEAVQDGYPDIIVAGPIILSPYLGRVQIARRTGDNEVVYHEYERWVEPLDSNLSHVIAADVGHLLNSNKVLSFSPQTGGVENAQSLRMRILRFEITADGSAHLEAKAALLRDLELEKFPVLHFDETLPAGAGVEAQVAALNELVHHFSRQLVEELVQVNEE